MRFSSEWNMYTYCHGGAEIVKNPEALPKPITKRIVVIFTDGFTGDTRSTTLDLYLAKSLLCRLQSIRYTVFEMSFSKIPVFFPGGCVKLFPIRLTWGERQKFIKALSRMIDEVEKYNELKVPDYA